jgi:hypothetical protein
MAVKQELVNGDVVLGVEPGSVVGVVVVVVGVVGSVAQVDCAWAKSAAS